MSQARLKTFICSAFSLIAWSSHAWSQTPTSLKPNCPHALEAVPVEKLSVAEISKLGPELIVSKGNYTMTFWPVDPEERAEKLGKNPIGFSLIQTRDMDTPPIGLLIRSTQTDELGFVKDGHQIMIGSQSQSSCPIRAILSVTETGGVVLRELASEKAR
ncbi:hypothetical protein [Aquidulcibacter sp.]|uniref:hypothetical protein n=1 Tax=Aquidulcibacter sp. TaxID=2052990 RepID=UPI003BA66CE0